MLSAREPTFSIGSNLRLPTLRAFRRVVTHLLTRTGGPAFDLACAMNIAGAPSFAQFAKGGNHERMQSGASLGMRLQRNLPPTFVHSQK
jgi:hypothetical protein